jgi:predicted alpha-1,2-mannosidase
MAHSTPLCDLVDAFHAVDGGGNCLPGPHLPLGIVRLGPDTINHNTNGYASHEDIAGFSHLHVSGTGGRGRYGNVLVVPLRQAPDSRLRGFLKENERAEPGYYAVDLLPREVFGEIKPASPRISCELTATHHCGLHRYTFGPDVVPHIHIDLGHCLAGVSIGGWVEATPQGTLVGRADYRGGWGHHHPYSVFFCIAFDTPCASLKTYSIHERVGAASADGPQMTAVASFPGAREVVVRVGISYTSVALAEKHLRTECLDRPFEDIRQQARAAWEQILGLIRTTGGTEDDRRLAATFLYRLYAMPDDLGLDENPWFNNTRRQFNNLYCLWDSVRNANSLFALLDPSLARDMANALLEIGQHTGWMPDAWIMGHSASIQGGSSADVILAEYALKGLPGIDYHAALAQMERNHDVVSPDPKFFGRYPEYRQLGYLPVPVRNATSRTLEYATQDNCAARLASWLGETSRAKRATERARRVWDNWRDDLKSMAPRDARGGWVDFDPWKPACPDFWNDPHFYEGTGHDWTLTLWHEIPELIRRHGGPEAFCAHLDRYLDTQYVWKEINLHTPWLYHYAGRPDRSAAQVRRMVRAHYKTGRRGLSDNEDMGSHSAFFLCSTMGIYPVPGTDLYLLNAPFFETVEITPAGTGTVIRIEAPGSGEDQRVQSATWNGRPLEGAWIRHADLAAGGTLHYILAPTPSNWGSTPPPNG